MTARRFSVFALATGAAALALFVTTLAPGLIGREDTPKFQFIGRVLGTAHNPGYPFYVVVSHLFGWLPFGNLAWRINLMSAVFASVTVALCQLTIVALGGSRVIAALAALGLATGTSFWLTATVAEVYALHGCLVAAMTYSLARWRVTGRRAWFFAAIGCFSIGLGHHTSIVTIGPAVAVFAIATAPRFALAPRTIAAILALFALGFSQYLFVMLRTLQGAWGESPASNFTELWGVMRGARWDGYVAPLTYGTIAARLPMVLRVLAAEVSLPVVGAASVGLVTFAVRDRAWLALSVGSMSGAIAFATFFPGETGNFLLPAYFFVWILAAIGLEAAVGIAASARPRFRLVATTTALLAVVVWHGVSNLEANDLSRRVFDMRYFDAVAQQLPVRSALVSEDYIVDRMLLYKRIGERAFEARDITGVIDPLPERVTQIAREGYTLFAMAKGASTLRAAGFAFDYSRWPLEYGTVRQFLADQPPGTVVAMAVPAMRLGSALAQGAAPFDAIGGVVPPSLWTNATTIGVVGRSGALQSEETNTTSVYAGRGLAIGTTGILSPADILVEAAYDRASIRIGSREVIRSHAPIVASWNARGQFMGAFALTAQERVPMPNTPLNLHRLRGRRDWSVVGEAPTDITALTASGHAMVRVPAASPAVVIYAGRDQPLAPRLFEIPESAARGFRVNEFAGGSAELALALRGDGWPAMPMLSMTHVYRIELPALSGSVHLGFGGVPDISFARWSAVGDAPSIYGIDLAGQLESIDDRTDRLHVARDHHEFFLGAGWSPISSDDVAGFSITTGTRAEILLPCEAGACTTVDIQLQPTREGDTVGLVVNGVDLPAQRMLGGWNRYSWTLPPAVLRAGTNSLVLQVSQPVVIADVLVPRSSRRRFS